MIQVVFPAGLSRNRKPRFDRANHVTCSGRAQLSLVEHALCPLSTVSRKDHFVHETTYGFRDGIGRRKEAAVRVVCPSGLSPADEFVLWGLLALTFAQQEPSCEFHATPHYCLRKLGLIEDIASKGGKDYRLFRDAIKRVSRVVYENTAFYDPIRGDHRDVAFGFLKYSLPIDPQSSRAWRFVWDQQFFEFAAATGGGLWFDLETYRRLDFASRRLFVFLQKIFYRSARSPVLDVGGLCVNVLGFAPTLDMRNLKIKLRRCIERLAEEGIVNWPCAAGTQRDFFAKHGVGKYSVCLDRGPYFVSDHRKPKPLTAEDSPLVDPLQAIGFDDTSIRRILREFKPDLVREWADITLAARERHGEEFFKKSAAAYCLDNLKHAAAGTRTPPDWWRELRREEQRRQHEIDRSHLQSASAQMEEEAFRAYLAGEAREAFESVMRQVVGDLESRGKSREEAEETGANMARAHVLNRFRREHPEFRSSQTTTEM